MPTTIQDRAKMIADSVLDMATRQMQEAVLADLVRVHLQAFLTQAVDGVYLCDGDGTASVFIGKEEYGGVDTAGLFKLVADKRAEMLAHDRLVTPEPMSSAGMMVTPLEAQAEAEAEEG